MSVDVRPAPVAGIYAYPWALHREGVDRAIDRISACGIDGVILAASYHVASFVAPGSRGLGSRGSQIWGSLTPGSLAPGSTSPGNPPPSIGFGDMGSLAFSDPAMGTWPLQPKISSWVGQGLDLAGMFGRLRAAGLDTTAWVVYCYNHALAGSRPELAVRNVFGDAHQAQLCPNQPAVRAYAQLLTRAVLGLSPLDGYHCESLGFLPFDYELINVKTALAAGPFAGLLLSLCWCDACRAAAKARQIDWRVLAASCGAWLTEHLAGLPDRSEAPLDADTAGWAVDQFGENMAALLELRRTSVLGQQREALDAAEQAGCRISSDAVEADVRAADGGLARDVMRLVNEVRVRATRGVRPETLAFGRQQATAALKDGATVAAFYNLIGFSTAEELLATVAGAVAAGFKHHRFYAYGLLSDRHLEWITEASALWSRR